MPQNPFLYRCYIQRRKFHNKLGEGEVMGKSANIGMERAAALKHEHLLELKQDVEAAHPELQRKLYVLQSETFGMAYGARSKLPHQKDLRFRRFMIVAGSFAVMMMLYSEDAIFSALRGPSAQNESSEYIPYVPSKTYSFEVKGAEMGSLRRALCRIESLQSFCK